MARPRKDIDARQVEALAAIGCSGEEIAAVIGCARSTVYERFRTAIEKGHEKRNASVRRAQYEVGVKKHNATMLIWLGKQYLGQKDQVATEVSGPGGGPQEIRLDISGIDPERLRALAWAAEDGETADTGAPGEEPSA